MSLKVLGDETADWKSCEITLPMPSSDYQQAFEGTSNSMGGLFVDNLKVYGQSGETAISISQEELQAILFTPRKGFVEVRTSEHFQMDVYTVFGVFHGRYNLIRGESILRLPSQLYIGICKGKRVRFVVY